jgi:magnesium transporter
MIRTLLYDRKTGESRWGDAGLIAEWTENPDLWIWADFSGEDSGEESRLLHEAFSLHPLVIADAQRDRHPPKLERFDEYFFLLINGLGELPRTSTIKRTSLPSSSVNVFC